MSAKRIVITVDGLAASGKSALSRALAEKLGFIHFSSGLLYRALGLLALEAGVGSEDVPGLKELLARHALTLKADQSRSAEVLIDGRPACEKLYKPEVSEMTSLISRHAEIRALLLPAQQQAFPGQNIVVEGRDTGTVVYPAADMKFFITADEKVRVERRVKQMLGSKSRSSDPRGLNILKREIEIEVSERDRRDSERHSSPTVPAQDAVIIDNSSQTLTAVVQSMYDSVSKRGLI